MAMTKTEWIGWQTKTRKENHWTFVWGFSQYIGVIRFRQYLLVNRAHRLIQKQQFRRCVSLRNVCVRLTAVRRDATVQQVTAREHGAVRAYDVLQLLHPDTRAPETTTSFVKALRRVMLFYTKCFCRCFRSSCMRVRVKANNDGGRPHMWLIIFTLDEMRQARTRHVTPIAHSEEEI